MDFHSFPLLPDSGCVLVEDKATGRSLQDTYAKVQKNRVVLTLQTKYCPLQSTNSNTIKSESCICICICTQQMRMRVVYSGRRKGKSHHDPDMDPCCCFRLKAELSAQALHANLPLAHVL